MSDRSSQRPIPDNTQQTQVTDIHGLGGIRTRNPSLPAAADPRLRLRGHWDRRYGVWQCKHKSLALETDLAIVVNKVV